MPFKKKWLKKLEETGRERKKAIDEYRQSPKRNPQITPMTQK
jgi:hypothetical protein